ncbi:YbfB/YjiJ family MFS transporter [Actinoallomurus sp. NBC_01490]|uniref:YbfB/YjiJ family MFS transporter n=1 Tax=Actinoallomurus sp. NBC_01490 TaxID=2903557 RepID=UPI002E316EF3|nr:YbfB/YjiJ family MFS transporter [Actinoallomurus sp. NBC_01490]
MCSASLQERGVTDAGAARSPRAHIIPSAAALAAGMGVGRFVYTPILPLMNAQAGLSAGTGASLATANYAGYLAGALGGILLPRLVRSSTVLRCSLVVLGVSLAAMPLTHATALWLALRSVAGVTSALIFVIAVSSVLDHLRGHPVHLPGWAFGGIGAGIALSGLLVLILRSVADWRVAWWAAAGLVVLLTVPSWNLRTEPPPRPVNVAGRERTGGRRVHRRFAALFVSYTLEGVGYIIAGTFLVAAIEQRAPAWIGSAAWALVGLAAIPSSALWAWLHRRWSRPGLLLTALIVQAVGVASPALVGGVAAALVSTALFGGTFVGVSTLALATGTDLRFPRSVALLTAGYSAGQIAGPLVVTPLLHHGYQGALTVAAAVILASAAAAVLLRIGFPTGDTGGRPG